MKEHRSGEEKRIEQVAKKNTDAVQIRGTVGSALVYLLHDDTSCRSRGRCST